MPTVYKKQLGLSYAMANWEANWEISYLEQGSWSGSNGKMRPCPLGIAVGLYIVYTTRCEDSESAVNGNKSPPPLPRSPRAAHSHSLRPSQGHATVLCFSRSSAVRPAPAGGEVCVRTRCWGPRRAGRAPRGQSLANAMQYIISRSWSARTRTA
jgi:hypothetical protein